MNKWQARVRQHYDKCVEILGDERRVFGVFLIGSQNYGLAEPTSDVDTKAIIFPSLMDIVTNARPLNMEMHFDNGEHMTITDYRLWFEQLQKGNPNVIEILHTDYFVLNSKYNKIWDSLFAIRENISHYNTQATCHAIKGLFYNECKYCFKSTEDKKAIFKQFYYNPKRLMSMMRLTSLLINYSKYNDTKSALIIPAADVKHFLEVKNGLYNLSEAMEIHKNYLQIIEQIIEEIDQDKEMQEKNNENRVVVKKAMDLLAKQAFTIFLRGEMDV